VPLRGQRVSGVCGSSHAAHHHLPPSRCSNGQDVTFSEDTSTSRTGSGPVNLATIRAAIIAAIKGAGYLHVPEGWRDHTTPANDERRDSPGRSDNRRLFP